MWWLGSAAERHGIVGERMMPNNQHETFPSGPILQFIRQLAAHFLNELSFESPDDILLSEQGSVASIMRTSRRRASAGTNAFRRAVPPHNTHRP